MSITKRITKFLLIAALAIPAWSTASAQNRTAPPEMAPTENQVREKAKDLKGHSVATRNSESRPVGKSVSINASNAIKLSTPISKVKVSTAPDGPKVKGVKPVNAVNSDAMSVEQRKDAAKPFKSAKLQNGAQPKILKVTKVTKTRADVPAGYSLITLNVAENPWTDGSGYQMLLDADHSTYGSTIPTSGALTSSGNASAATYAEFEYKIPENADGSLTTTNMIASGSQSITIPAGTYDWCVTNPSPGDRVWIASEYGVIQGRYDDYVFESGFAYVFTISSYDDSGETHDQLSIGITSNFENPTNLTASINANTASLSWTAGGDETSWNVQYKKKTEYAWTTAGTTNSPNYILEDLSCVKEYQARVQGIYAGGLSGWTMVSFTTDNLSSYDDLCDPEDRGEISYTLNDSYGDGWNGNSIQIVDAETGYVIETLTFSSGSSVSGTVSLCYGRTVNFVWNSGSYAYECSFTITDPDGEGIYNETDGSNLTDGEAFATYTMMMPVKPTDLAVSGVSYNRATATWNGVTETYNLRYRPNGETDWVVVENVTSPYTMTGLAPLTQYEVQVQGILDGGVSNWTNSVVFTTLESVDPTTELDFGSVDVESSKTLSAYIANQSDSPVTATLTVAPNPPFSVAETTVTLAANTLTSIPVTFTPSEARSYTGTLTVVAGDVTTTIPLKGVGNMSGPEAVRDSAFYAGISYKWPINVTNPTETSRLDEVATDPDQMIALIREVYTNKSIPGNFKRGYANTGGTSYFGTHDNNVQYTGAGLIERDGSYVSFSDAYGWDIPTDDITIDNSGSVSCAYMNPYQYKPDNEGVTLLLLEMLDDFNTSNVTVSATGYAGLRELFSKTLKSVRVITQAKRTGTGEARGTLFNIDCDKMNKFYLLAKGQLGWLRSAWFENQNSTFTSFYTEPCYIYGSNYDEYVDPALEKFFFLGHMFEQFSPASPNATATELDLYRKMSTAGDAFPVIHDCPNVPYVENGHHFMMYGTESGAADCQDVRDMMFFVPDYRMMDHADRGSKSSSNSSFIYQDYFEYNPNHKPQMGLYVIIQDTVEAVTRADDYFKLKLTWDSNMDEFMPGDQQEYQLYQVVTDEFGVSSWKPVYYTKVVNNQVVYTDKNGNVVTTPVPIVLTLDPSSSKKTYTEVYVQRADASTEVTYAIRGQDTGHFLSLQMSNEQSYVIPGKDPAEMVLMSSATVYSRYEAQNENNCYSNKIQMKAAPKTIKASYLPTESTMTLYRSYAKVENGATVTVTEPIATLTVTNSGNSKYFTVSGSVVENQAAVKALFPKGTDNYTAGYHANNFTNNRINFSTQTISGTEYINFDLTIWDNFVANVSKNEHPGLYTYQLRFNTAESFPGLNGTTNEAYSSPIRVYVYKTDSKVNEPLTLDQVKGDTGCNSAYTPGDVEFSAQVMLSSKGEILRYDAYRWVEGAPRSIILEGGATDEDEEDVDPNGIAGNQGDSYTVTMNEVGTDNYYVGSAVPVTETAPLNWAKFVDYYPATLTDGGSFTYAPVVELFTKGYQSHAANKERGDYNTYGGPLKTTAVGKMELEIPDNLNTAGNPFMSTYKWFDGQNWCAYYKIPVKFHALGIPEGYEIYKIRAWRDVDTNILREELSDHQDRIAANYLFEDLTYGDALGDGHTMSKANLFQNDQGTIHSYELGRRAIGDPDPQSENYTGETHATFGALRINTDDGQPYAIDNLTATIKVRAYFTKTSNPILSDPIYVIANNGSGWDYDTPLATLTCEDGANFTGTVTIPAANDGSGKGYFFFSKQLGSSWETNAQYIFGPEASGNEVLGEWPNNAGYNLKYWQSGTKVFEVYPGTYQLSIGSHVQDLATSAQYGYQAGYITITRVANSKAPTRDLVPADYGYYVAEGSIEFNSNMFNEIITGVTDVKMEANREVMSVSYVNTVGQVSSTPWQGVNVVVVRYTDGSTSTSKVIK